MEKTKNPLHRSSLKKSLVLVAVLALSLSACSKDRTGTTTAVSDAQKLGTTFPHPQGWSASHIQIVSGQDEGKQGENCASCHNTKENAARPLSATISCATKCHPAAVGSTMASLTAGPHRATVTANAKCNTCHADMNAVKYSHYPFTVGLCDACHTNQPGHEDSPNSIHAAGNTNPDQTCYKCHFRKDDMPNVHPALTSGKSCVGCHNPHGAEFRNFLPAKTQELCLKCHSGLEHAGKSVHGPISSEQSCLSCHGPHSTVEKKMLSLKGQQLCFSCHDKEIEVTGDNARVIPNMKKKITESAFVHSAIDDNCTSSCHKPHASEFSRLLQNNFPIGSNYNQYNENPNTYDLCFTCHDNGMLKQDITKGDTNFRKDEMVNGVLKRKNLHWFHVVDAAGGSQKQNGRSCFVCHDPHGADQQSNIRSSWKMGHFDVSVVFTPNANGGDCAKTCHTTRSYTRINQ